MSSFFYLNAQQSDTNTQFIDQARTWCEQNHQQGYIIDRPLGDSKYAYENKSAFLLLVPKHKLVFVNFKKDDLSFNEYIDDFIEDLGSISDKYRYKDVIGRPKSWKDDLISSVNYTDHKGVAELLAAQKIVDPQRQRVGELLISLLTGSINDIEKVKAGIPENLLDKIKRKILLFDGDQTRFVYQEPTKQAVRIQGLSGTGKTELLLHKLKEIYVSSADSRIIFTCHNKVLAESLKRRVPDFFTFMKVEEQIRWNERLWCVHAWGSQSDKNSGTYRYICDFYGIPFNRYSRYLTFDRACSLALDQIKGMKERQPAFDFMLIDESQDFPESFFELCEEVTKETVYIAGDIFQSIFDESIGKDIEPDFLLSKCYRTDPKTLMFAHAIGMGLFETVKLRWLDDDEWSACGYAIEHLPSGIYRLRREPLRRFEDLEKANIQSVELSAIDGPFYDGATRRVMDAIKAIKDENPSVTADDIGIIFLDINNAAYAMADELEQLIPRTFGWPVNKAHETKSSVRGAIFLSNKNNVKGLEFPFVICISERITQSYSYRNSLYMTITRSFLRTYFIFSRDQNAQILPPIYKGLDVINKHGYIEATPPSDNEKKAIQTKIKFDGRHLSFYEFVTEVFDELNVQPVYRADLLETVVKVSGGETFDKGNVREIVQFNYGKMLGH